jgi:anti-sigma factor RsiW
VSAPKHEEFACQELVELVTDYLDGALPPELKDKFQTHLTGCDGCVEYLRQIGLTIRALKQADLHLAPTAAREADHSDG